MQSANFDDVLVHGRYRVNRHFFNAIRYQLEGIESAIPLDQIFTARELCDGLWLKLDFQDRPMAGSCLSHLVKTGQMPLVKVSPPRKYPCRYRLDRLT